MSIEATLSTWKLTKSQVTPTQKLILLSLADRAGEDAECWPSIKRLEADTGLDRKSIMDNRKKLIEKNLITYTGEMKGFRKQVPVMRLNYVLHRESTSPESGTGKKFTGPESGTRTGPESGTLNLKEEPTNIKPIVHSSNEQKESLQLFIKFWEAYPRKQNKENTKKAWMRKKLDKHIDAILENLTLRAKTEWKGKDTQYIPLPLSYLNGRRWEDEIAVPKSSTPIHRQSNMQNDLDYKAYKMDCKVKGEEPLAKLAWMKTLNTEVKK